jgi:peptidyl-prolyl cis-trans isomerase C
LTQSKNRAARFALIAAVAGALSFPIVSEKLRAEDKPAAAAAPAGKANPVTATPKVDPATVVVSGGEFKVTAEEFEGILGTLPPEQQASVTGSPENKKRFADQILKMKALAGEAQKRKLDEDPKVKEQLATIEKQLQVQLKAARQQVLIQSMIQKMQGDEAADKKYFDANADQFSEVEARHILISTQPSENPAKPRPTLTDEQAKKKADDIRARLVKGEDFGALVKAESDDEGSKNTGGVYTFGRGKMVPAFEQAAFALKEKEISQPIKTNYGYHVIQLMKRVPVTFEASRGTIAGHRIEALLVELLGKDKELKFNEAFLAASGGGGTDPRPAQPALKAAPEDPAKK